jgi:F-type H+-transporting ATPase subunit b
MGETLSQLGQLLVQTIPTILLVLFLLYFLDWMFFRPLTKTLEEREAATTGALERAREQTVEAEEKFRQYEAILQKARMEIYLQLGELRKQALSDQEGALQKSREQADKLLHEAQAGIAAELEKATTEIRGSLGPLVQEIADLALNVPVSESLEGGDRP